MKHLKRILIIAAFTFLTPLAAFSQVEGCPVGYQCITQEAANKARENKLELDATKEKVKTLEAALEEKDKNVREAQETARKNEADLKERLHKTENELALKTGQLIKAEAQIVWQVEMMQFMLKHGRKKCYGICAQF